MRPLDGITVVSLEHAVAAPFATRQLADLGARVIKIERPGSGDFARHYDKNVLGQSAYFVWLNRSKESLTLDLKHRRAGPILAKLIESADVFVQNLAPGAALRAGLDAETLLSRHPRLIVCDISGYGESGPYSQRRAYDLLIQAEVGLLSVTGTPDTPCKAGISIADISAGQYAYSGILAALFQRERTGVGCRVEVSMFEAMAEWMTQPLLHARYAETSLGRTAATHATIAPYGPFSAGDGEVIILAVQNHREWERFCRDVLKRPQLTEDPRFESNPRRIANLFALTEIIQEVFATLAVAEVKLRLDRAQIAHAQMNSAEQVLNHPHLEARKRWREVPTQGGDVRVLLPPATMSGVEPRMDRVPSLGEHTDSVLKELGYSEPDVEELRAESVI